MNKKRPFYGNQYSKDPKSLIERFWEKVDKKSDDECWDWVASLRSDGYGQLTYTEDGQRWCLPVHRLSWAIHFGEVPHSRQVLHKCDNPKCVNPNHLFLGTGQDNMRDKTNKHRQMYGNDHTSAKLMAINIPYIKRAYANGRSLSALAREFGVYPSTIQRVVEGKTWKSVK